jgi:hypothetical protein
MGSTGWGPLMVVRLMGPLGFVPWRGFPNRVSWTVPWMALKVPQWRVYSGGFLGEATWSKCPKGVPLRWSPVRGHLNVVPI